MRNCHVVVDVVQATDVPNQNCDVFTKCGKSKFSLETFSETFERICQLSSKHLRDTELRKCFGLGLGDGLHYIT